MDSKKAIQILSSHISDLGFIDFGIAPAEFMEEEAKNLELWLSKGNHGSMSYMENHFDLRVDPTKLVPGAKSVISLLYNYYPEQDLSENGSYKIAKYAYGRDYHKVVKKKLKELISRLREDFGAIEGRAFVDSAPILERDWAKRAGLGWIGKNTLLLHKTKGSFFFLAELIIDFDFQLETPKASLDYCGTCTKCIDACPTNAIDESGYILDASKCISYLTIERKDNIPNEFKNLMEDWIFGCDICQDVCPWNRFSTEHQEEDFRPKDALQEFSKQDWIDISQEVFQTIFQGSPVKRTKYEGLMRNINFIHQNSSNNT